MFAFTFADPRPDLTLYTHDQVIQKMAEVKASVGEEEWDFIWKSGEQPPITISDDEDEGQEGRNATLIPPTPQKLSSQDAEKQLPPKKRSVAVDAADGEGSTQEPKDPVEGLKPESYYMLGGAIHSWMDNIGFDDLGQFLKVSDYLYKNSNYSIIPIVSEGDCLFDSIRALFWMWVEFTSTHFRRDIVMFILEHFKVLKSDLGRFLVGNFGCTRISGKEYKRKKAANTLTHFDIQDREAPPPQSYGSYLNNMLTKNFWGDEFILTCAAKHYMVKISLINAESLRPTHIMHTGPWWKAHLVLVMSGSKHFLPAAYRRKNELGKISYHLTPCMLRKSEGYRFKFDDDKTIWSEQLNLKHVQKNEKFKITLPRGIPSFPSGQDEECDVPQERELIDTYVNCTVSTAEAATQYAAVTPTLQVIEYFLIQ